MLISSNSKDSTHGGTIFEGVSLRRFSKSRMAQKASQLFSGGLDIAPGETIEETQQEFKYVMQELAQEDKCFNEKPIEVE